ncbi:MAG TPA: SDR family oxidoreductase [Solirubrobacteraceae bacterium]|nr:SDR family oxidoreductase [Solirubrobacteraceae bacterium]
MSNPGRVFLTGATGFVGMEVLVRYLERGSRPVTCLVRAESDQAARARLDKILDELIANGAELFAHRVEAVAGEMTEADLGLSSAVRERLAGEVTTIIHCAANVAFDQTLESARTINVGGTRRMLEFATLVQQQGQLDRYAQVSTAYVAGMHTGRFSEDDLDVGQEFRNTYEQSKFESEKMIRAEADHLPWIVLRPSIIVGDQSSGWTSAFNVMYWPLRALSTGLFRAVPAMPESPLDIVSIDYVADAIYELCECPQDSAHKTFLLTASEDASSFSEIVSLASRYFRKPEPEAVAPADFSLDTGSLSDAAMEAIRVYFPYFAISTIFDNNSTRARLSQAGIHCTPLREYMHRLLDFATQSRWGKRPIARAEAPTG